MGLHAAFDPLGATPSARRGQFAAACDSVQSSTGDTTFWVAVFVLGIDKEVGTAFDNLTADHGAPEKCLDSYSGRDTHHRILGSLKNVRRSWGHDFWHKLVAQGITIPTNPPVHLASSLSKLARAHKLGDAIRGLGRSLQNKRPGPRTNVNHSAAVTTNSARYVQNVDVTSALTWLKKERPQTAPEDEESQEDTRREDAPPPRKRPRLPVPSSERARGITSTLGGTQRGNRPNSSAARLDLENFPPSPHSPRSQRETGRVLEKCRSVKHKRIQLSNLMRIASVAAP
jgi:hypothetical protein